MDEKTLRDSMARNWLYRRKSGTEVTQLLFGWAIGEYNDDEMIRKLKDSKEASAKNIAPEEKVRRPDFHFYIQTEGWRERVQ